MEIIATLIGTLLGRSYGFFASLGAGAGFLWLARQMPKEKRFPLTLILGGILGYLHQIHLGFLWKIVGVVLGVIVAVVIDAVVVSSDSDDSKDPWSDPHLSAVLAQKKRIVLAASIGALVGCSLGLFVGTRFGIWMGLMSSFIGSLVPQDRTGGPSRGSGPAKGQASRPKSNGSTGGTRKRWAGRDRAPSWAARGDPFDFAEETEEELERHALGLWSSLVAHLAWVNGALPPTKRQAVANMIVGWTDDTSTRHLAPDVITAISDGPEDSSSSWVLLWHVDPEALALALQAMSAFHSEPKQFVRSIYESMAFVVLCDGEPSGPERSLLNRIWPALQLTWHEAKEIEATVWQLLHGDESHGSYDRASSSSGSQRSRGTSDRLAWAYEVLGACPSDSDVELRRKYRELLRKYHPDRVAGADLPPEVASLMEEKYKEIREAYDVIMQSRGHR